MLIVLWHKQDQQSLMHGTGKDLAQTETDLLPERAASQCESQPLKGKTKFGAGDTWVPTPAPHLPTLDLVKLLKL